MKLLITIALLTVVLLAVIHLSYSSVKEADVDAFGDSVQDIDVEAYLDEYIEKIDGKSTNVEEVLNENTNLDGQIIRIRNNYNNAITLYWDGTQFNQGVHLMATLAPHDVAAFDTTVGHKFYALSVGEESRVTPYQIIVRKNVEDYSFGTSKKSQAIESDVTETGIHPRVKLLHSPTTAMSVKFRCLAPAVDYYYENGKGGSFQGHLTLGRESTINTYEGHVFFFTEAGNKDKELARFVMHKDQVLHKIVHPDHPPPADLQLQQEREESFLEEYYNRTGIRWRHYYGPNGPRAPPILFMWPADHVGQVHTVESTEGFWSCKGSSKDCQSPDPVELKMEVVSLGPRAFLIEDFLSGFEAEAIIEAANATLKESSVGNKEGGGTRKSETRTSRNSWVNRKTNYITESLFLRAADLLNIDERLLNNNENAEDMQVVHYVNGQKYDSHHDWGVSGYPESRFITLLLYLTDMAHPQAGGETSFPKGANGGGFKVEPKKGSAVLFYDLLEDGNGDDLALHAALPVWEGEKWLANFWVWDPKRK